MITNFNLFGIEHIASILMPILIGIIFIFLSYKYPNKKKLITVFLAILIMVFRAVRYVFDINIGVFEISKLFSLHICNIDFYVLLLCLFKPNRKLFIFTFLVGIPTALSVALMPGRIHPDPGMARAIFFIMSHMLLVVGPIYLQVVYNFKITKKDLYFYYIFAFVGTILMYLFNIITNSNYMYLIYGPEGTVLEKLYNIFGPYFYTISIFTILIILITGFYFTSKLISKICYTCLMKKKGGKNA